MNNVSAIHHVSLIIADLSVSIAFYEGLLGLEQAERPQLSFPGVWFRIGDQQLHLLQVPDPDAASQRPNHGGRDRHLALSVENLEQLCSSLDAKAVPYTRSKSGRAAIFCRDPDGNALELIQK